MPPAKLSEAVKAILEATRRTIGDIEFSAEHAEILWGGSKAVKLADLTDIQLLQYCLISTHAEAQEMVEAGIASAPSLIVPNRETRRKLEKGR
jgi:hypothetical protein